MDATHFHVVFTHGVFWLVAVGTILLGIALLRKSGSLRMTALMLMTAGSLLSIPVYLTGEEAEHTVEEYGIEHEVIEPHEEAAELLFIFLLVLGAASTVTMILLRRPNTTGTIPTIIVLLLALTVTAMTARVANMGGEIRHEEIRP